VNSLLPTTAQGTSAGCELVTSDGRALALVSATLRGEAQGGLARLVLEQRFANPYDETLKVTYRMPLPADGAISGYEFVIGERVVKGVIDKKRQARERFERAIIEGRTAALLEQERADIFTQQIGNIPAREAVVARITIDQRLVWLPEGEWELRFPTVIGPRYIGSADSAEDVRATHIKVTDKPLPVTIQIEITVRDAIVAGAKPSSPSHVLESRGDIVELKVGSRLDRDIVLRWPVATPDVGLSLAAARAPSGNDAYALLTIVPPAKEAHPVAVARDMIVLLDTSGSMGGFPLDKAKQVVCMMIDSLDERDRLELIEFSDRPRRYLQEPVLATAGAKAAAIKWVRSRVADGGTEMRAGVIEALQTLRVGAQRQVIVVTDGYVGGEQQILEALNRRLPKSCTLHVLGVGSAVNRSLATSLARAGRGVEVIVGVDEDAERGAKRLLDRTRSPMVTNIEISGSALLRHAPATMPDCFGGAPLVAALAIKPEGGEIRVRGRLARDAWEQRITVKPLRQGEGNPAIIALYGRERVADVEANAVFSTVDGEVEDLGLTFQIATRMTSWVAIDEIRRTVGFTREQVVPQELPYGTTASAFGLRGAAVQQQSMAGFARHDIAAFAKHDATETLRSLSVDAASFADLDEGGDFGEEAPAEVFAEAPTPARSAPPRPASPTLVGAARRPAPGAMGGAPRSKSDTLKDEYAGAADDADFESEEPTGQRLRVQEEADPMVPAAPAPEPAKPRLALEQIVERPAPAKRTEAEKAEAEPMPESRTRRAPGMAPPQQDMPPPALKRLDAAQEQQAVAPMRRKSPTLWVMLALLLALIALVIWWLAA
jgi:Ca-activated chloride channel family protein